MIDVFVWLLDCGTPTAAGAERKMITGAYVKPLASVFYD